MDWGTLAPTALGGLLALGGGFLGQWWSERRAVEREQRAWARDQKARSYEATRLAYSRFLGAYDEHVDVLMRQPEEIDFSDWDWAAKLDPLVTEVVIFGTKPAAKLARTMVQQLLDHGFDHRSVDPLDMQDARLAFVEELRADLGIE
jgi:hypothetical protein